jgi:hypothetical protein
LIRIILSLALFVATRSDGGSWRRAAKKAKLAAVAGAPLYERVGRNSSTRK